MNHQPTYAGRAHDDSGGSILISDSMVNFVKGIIVHSHYENLHQPTVRIRAGRQVDMRIILPIGDERCFFPGQPVIARIPAEAVRLEAGLFRRSRQRLNRWYGRIVLVTPHREGYAISAKVHGERWSLTSTIRALGATDSARTWDSVNIVVDPQRVEVFPRHQEAPQESEALEYAPHR